MFENLPAKQASGSFQVAIGRYPCRTLRDGIRLRPGQKRGLPALDLFGRDLRKLDRVNHAKPKLMVRAIALLIRGRDPSDFGDDLPKRLPVVREGCG